MRKFIETTIFGVALFGLGYLYCNFKNGKDFEYESPDGKVFIRITKPEEELINVETEESE